MTLSHDALIAHADIWIATWNAHDVEAVLKPWADDGVFVSPTAAIVTGSAEVRGKSALRQYWTQALSRVPDLRFELVAAYADEGASTLAVHYISHAGGRKVRAVEIMVFEQGDQSRGEAFYGAVAAA